MRLRPRRTYLVTERTKMKDKDEHDGYEEDSGIISLFPPNVQADRP